MADQATGCGDAMSGKTAEPLTIPAPPPMPSITGSVFGSSGPAALFEDAVQGGEGPYESDGDYEDSDVDEQDDGEARSGTAAQPGPPMPTWNSNQEEEIDDDEDEEIYETDDDSDSEFEEDDWPPEFARDGEVDGKQHPALDFVEFINQPARFASDESTAGFMRVAAAESAEPGQDGSGSEIVVHYRYTFFSRSLINGGVAVRHAPKLHRVRFLVPSPSAADDTASSLRLAGAALAGLIYPSHYRKQLRALWSSLLAAAARAPATLPPMAARLDVTVDVGVLQRRDGSPDRVARMLTALPAVAWKVDDGWPATHDVVTMRLPAPVRCCAEDDQDDGDVRPAKRRRLAAGEEEECAICWEVMKKGLASWPRCSHVFHGQCLEELLVRGDQRCPMCRSELRVEASG